MSTYVLLGVKIHYEMSAAGYLLHLLLVGVTLLVCWLVVLLYI